MKKLLPLFLMLAVHVGAFAEGHALKVTLTDGSTETYELSEKPQISFEGKNMVITSSSVSTNYLRSDVATITFEASITSVNDAIDPENIVYRYENNIFEAEGTDISVYAISGSLITKGKNMVSLQSLQSGTYVIRAGKQSIKVNKK